MIFFLDADGVFNTPRVAASRSFKDVGPTMFGAIDPICVAFLNRWIDRVENHWSDQVQIVFSSTWRRGTTQMGATQLLEAIGIRKANLHKDWRTPIESEQGYDRGYQIDDWTMNNPEHDKWMIIDDSTDMLENQMHRLVRCCPMNGITFEVHEKAVEIIDGVYEGCL